MLYDRRGKVVRNLGNGDSLAYTALGHLRYGRYTNATGVEAYTYDAAGDKVAPWSERHSSDFFLRENESRSRGVINTPKRKRSI